MMPPIRHHGYHDVVKVFLKFEDELDAGNFVGDTKVDGLRELTKSIASPGSRAQAPTSFTYSPVSFC